MPITTLMLLLIVLHLQWGLLLSVTLNAIKITSPSSSIEVMRLDRGIFSIRNFTTGVSIEVDLTMERRQYELLLPTSRICVHINGMECKCFAGSLQSTIMVIDGYDCIPRPSDWSRLWLSLSFHSDSTAHLPVMSSPLLLLNEMEDNDQSVSVSKQAMMLTLVLPLTLNDLSRVMLLFHTLHLIPSNMVLEMLVFCPDFQRDIISKALSGFAPSLQFPVVIYGESLLFVTASASSPSPQPASLDPYGLQMALKLLCAHMVRTRHYITLDADVLLLHPLLIDLVVNDRGQALYRHESWHQHEHWWQGSRSLLGMPPNPTPSEDIGFGVTPAVLSTWGSLLTLQSVRRALCATIHPPCSDWPRQWVASLGKPIVWTEYTLYRTALDAWTVFDELHFRESSSGGFLTCNEVWFRADWPWDVRAAYGNVSCLFSLVQSTASIGPSAVLRMLSEALRAEVEVRAMGDG